MEVLQRDWLRRERKRQGFTTYTLAEAVGVSQGYYARIESGKKTPSVPVAKRIASVLLFSWEMFFRDVA